MPCLLSRLGSHVRYSALIRTYSAPESHVHIVAVGIRRRRGQSSQSLPWLQNVRRLVGELVVRDAHREYLYRPDGDGGAIEHKSCAGSAGRGVRGGPISESPP